MRREGLLETLTFSSKRERLMLLLMEGPKTLPEINGALGVTSTGMIPQIRIPEQKNLVSQQDRYYSLTPLGKVASEALYPLVRTLRVIETHEYYWREHDLSIIPQHLLRRISELGDCKLIERSPENIYEPRKEFIENIVSSKRIFGISPIFNSAYPPAIIEAVLKGATVSLILNQGVVERVKSEIMPILELYTRLGNKIYVPKKDLQFGCALTDTYFSLSSAFKSGDFDPGRDIISFEPSARAWGEELFNWYVKGTEELKI